MAKQDRQDREGKQARRDEEFTELWRKVQKAQSWHKWAILIWLQRLQVSSIVLGIVSVQSIAATLE